MRILVLGAYGLIGNEVTRALVHAGHDVVGLGRNPDTARRRLPAITWCKADLSHLTTDSRWAPILADARPDVIVNCAGVLQDGLTDNVAVVHHHAIGALVTAATAARISRFVQISAPAAAIDADTAFMRTKGEGDAALQASALDWTILRPGLVVAREAYGGSALLRALAAFPLIQPLAFADATVQTVDVTDIADAVIRVVAGGVTTRQVYDLVEAEPRTLADTVSQMRAWLGKPPAPKLLVPDAVTGLIAKVGDVCGWLGWRPPLRTTTLAELRRGVSGDPTAWHDQTGAPLSSLRDTLMRHPATVQERWFAHAFLLKPVVLVTLSAFWLATGLIGIAAHEEAAQILTQRGVGDGPAAAFVWAGIVADLVVGSAISFRRTARAAAIGMIALTLAYLVGGTVLTPDLWLDPLGALLKPIPAMVLAVVALAMLETR